jgi:hypothetical protein
MKAVLLLVIFNRACGFITRDEMGGPLRNHYTYRAVNLPAAAAAHGCTQFSLAVPVPDWTYDTLHITGDILFHGDGSGNVKWITHELDEVHVSWCKSGWVLYVGTGNSSLAEVVADYLHRRGKD